jgi:hypothetical protein
MTQKSRDIPLGEYLDALSREYMVAFVRSKTLNNTADRKHWAKVASKKRSRIEDISNRNAFPNLFNSRETYLKYFTMRSEDDMPIFLKTREDVDSYYSAIGSEVVVQFDGASTIGHISAYNDEQQSCDIDVSGKVKNYDIRDVRRFI